MLNSIRRILPVLICPFLMFHNPVNAQEMLRLGVGYFKEIDGKSFYAPMIVQNLDVESVNILEGEPIIEMDGKDLRVQEDLVHDKAAYSQEIARWITTFRYCQTCEFQSINPETGENRSWVGYNGIFTFGTDFFRDSHPILKEKGYLGFTYKLQPKSNTKLLILPVIDEVKQGSPAQLAGVKSGNELSKIEISKGITESLYNLPLEWLIEKMAGKVGTYCTLLINETQRKTFKRANLYGEVDENPQIVANCLSGDCNNGYGIKEEGRTRYEGGFEKGQYMGLGKIYEGGKLAFEGYFKAGKKNGSGTEYLSNGTRIESIYTLNKVGNNLKYTRPDGLVYYELWQGEVKSYFDASMNPIDIKSLPKLAETPITKPVTSKNSTTTSTNTGVASKLPANNTTTTKPTTSVTTPTKSASTASTTPKTSPTISVTTKPTSTVSAKPSATTTTPPSTTPKSSPTTTFATQSTVKTTTTTPSTTKSYSSSIPNSTKTKAPDPVASTPKMAPVTNSKTYSQPTSVHKSHTVQDPAQPSISNTPQVNDACQRCNGTGLYSEFEKCTEKGCYAGYTDCVFCKGTGTVENAKTHKKEACTHCRYINDQVTHGVVCNTCKGTGMVRSQPKFCIFCQGRGKRLK